MDNLVDYIKQNYPKVIFTPFKFKQSRALAFIISDNKLVIGYINSAGSLCKLINPIDLENLTNEDTIYNIVKSIPTVSGFNEEDKSKLLKLFESKSETIEKSEQRKIENDLKRRIEENNDQKIKDEYKALYDSNSNQILLIKNEYEERIAKITEQYNTTQQELESCKRQIIDQKDAILEGINQYKNEIQNFIQSKDLQIQDLENIHQQDKEERTQLQERLNELLKNERRNLQALEENKDNVSDYDTKIETKRQEIESLTSAIQEIKSELNNTKEELKRSQLQETLLIGFRERCKDKILTEKQQIIDKIIEYNQRWNEWLEKSTVDVNEYKRRLLTDLQSGQESLKSVLQQQSEKSNIDDMEIKRLKQNIVDIETALKQTINDQLIKLSEREEEIKRLSEEKDELQSRQSDTEQSTIELQTEIDSLREANKSIPDLQRELEEVRALLSQNDRTKIESVVDYDNCESILTNFVALNNIFYRKQEIIKRLDDIITNNLDVFSKISEDLRNTIRKDFETVKTEITNHIKFLNLSEYINSPNFQYLKNKINRDQVPADFCKDLSNLLEYWNVNKSSYRRQDRILTNIYEDLSGAVRVYIRIKPLLGGEQQSPTVSLKTVESKRTKSLIVDCSESPNTKFKDPLTFGEFYGIFDEKYTNLDLYTGQIGYPSSGLKVDLDNLVDSSDSVSPGLYNVFNQIQDGYSVVLFGYGLSGSGKCHGADTPIIMYDGTIKKVQDIQEGDLLMGDDSTARRVFSLARGRDIMYEVTNVKGERYIVNSEHILSLKYTGRKQLRDRPNRHSFILNWFNKEKIGFNSKTFSYKNKDKDEVHQEAKEFTEKVKDDLYIDIPIKRYLSLSNHFKDFLKGYKVPVEFPHRDLEIDPYMIGFWLGDGTSSQPEITNQDSTIIKYFKENLQQYKCYLQYKNNQGTNNMTYRINGEKSNGCKGGNNYFLNILKKYDLINNKHIPHIYKCNSRENRLKLLAGILDADGSYDRKKKTFEFSQSLEHEQIMDDVIYLCRSLGFACYKNKKQTSWTYLGKKNYGEAWIISITGEGIEKIPTLCKRKQAEPRRQIKDVLVSGIKIKELPEDDYYGFEIDGNHHYLLGNFTVTHNTMTLLGSNGAPGLLHYGLSNLQNVSKIKIKYLFEQYYYKINFNYREVTGHIHNLINKVPQMTSFSKDENEEFKQVIPGYLDVNSMKVEDLSAFTDIVDSYRQNHGRIKQTPNNTQSSRSHLYYVFEITFTNGKSGYITIVDMAGRESPLDIFNTFIDSTKTTLPSVMAPAPVGGEGNIANSMKEELVETYTPKQIYQIINESFYINETINHLIYYFNLKNDKKIETPKQKVDERFNVVYKIANYFVKPEDEMTNISSSNNALTIPILNFLNNLNTKQKESNDWKPTKFVTICCIRQEQNYCNQTMETVKFAQNIRST